MARDGVDWEKGDSYYLRVIAEKEIGGRGHECKKLLN